MRAKVAAPIVAARLAHKRLPISGKGKFTKAGGKSMAATTGEFFRALLNELFTISGELPDIRRTKGVRLNGG
jgi:hypothetical protein